MITSENNTEEIAIEFVTTSGATVADFAARYPGSEKIIAAVATENWVGTNAFVADSTVRSIGLSMLEARKSALQFTLNGLVIAQGLEAEDVATTLQLPVALFWKLHRRLIAFETLPTQLAGKLADVLGKTTEEIRAYLRLSPQLATGASFKANEMPEITQESFLDALESEGTPEEIAAWS
jgi:hypothetical protein